jgi:hypothetical protein
MMTMTLPKATVSSQAACTTAFMLSGAWITFIHKIIFQKMFS